MFCVAKYTGTAMAMPSGMLWMAMAKASGMPTDGLSSVAKNVASPSGKLCAVIATEVSRATRFRYSRLFSRNAGSCLSRLSCGLGMKWSINTITTTPSRKARVP
ncbi:hypothetical protein D3C72_1930700 [compost metagenome]